MNRTQKGAWFGLATSLLCITILVWGAIRIPNVTIRGRILMYWPIAAFLLLLTIMFFVIRKKQSPTEVASDERDNMIRTRAVRASLISLLVMFPALACFMVLASNDEGMVNAFIMPGLSVLILLIAMAVYSITTLVQYGRGGKDTNKIQQGEYYE